MSWESGGGRANQLDFGGVCGFLDWDLKQEQAKAAAFPVNGPRLLT